MAVTFTPTTWNNGVAPGISATELNRIETGIDDTVTAYNAHIADTADNHAIDGLSDVIITTPSTDQVLRYNGSNWVNGSAALDSATDVVITSPADNELLAYDSGSGDWINQTAAEAGIVDEDLRRLVEMQIL